MIKIKKLFILFVASFFLMPLVMGMEVKVKEEAFFNQEFPSAVVLGKIVFQSNRDGALSEIWVLENGQIKKIASGKNTDKDIPKQLSGPLAGMLSGGFADLREPKWSPDGLRILCVQNEKLIILSVDGTIQSEIKPKKPPYSAVWSPDGLSIYYKTADRLPQGGGAYNIYKLNLNDKTEQKITNIPPAPGITSILSFAVSPDDKKIAMTIVGDSNISIWTVNMDGSDFKMLVKYARDPAWSPDGTKLAYITDVFSGSKKSAEYHKIFIFDLETMQATQITKKGWEDRRPVFSPDGTKIAFESYRHREIAHGSEIFVINVDGTGEARLTPSQQNPKYPNDMFRGWSTDQYPDWHA
jgi:Tol biopolymer transport system component